MNKFTTFIKKGINKGTDTYKHCIEKFKQTATVKVSVLQLLLTAFYVAVLLTSNIIATKMIKLPFSFFGLDYITCASVVIFPMTCVLSDIFSEVYGYSWSRFTCYLGFVISLFVAIIFAISIALPYPVWWADGNVAFKMTLGNTFYILLASYISYMTGDFVNDKIFAKLKDKYHKQDSKRFSIRAILSTLCGQFFDSGIYLPLAFIIFPAIFGDEIIMTWKAAFTMICLQAIVKTLYEFILLPITTAVVKFANKYENKNMGEEVTE